MRQSNQELPVLQIGHNKTHTFFEDDTPNRYGYKT